MLSGCATQWAPTLELGAGHEFDHPRVTDSVTGVARLKQPLWPQQQCTYESIINLELEHISGLGTPNDNPLNQGMITFRIPLHVDD